MLRLPEVSVVSVDRAVQEEVLDAGDGDANHDRVPIFHTQGSAFSRLCQIHDVAALSVSHPGIHHHRDKLHGV
jgi:hypothetical protein